MLVLSRRYGESLVIDTGTDRIEVMITDIRRDQVRLGISAPLHIRIVRTELLSDDGRGGSRATNRPGD